MRVRKVDANGDMTFGGNQASFYRDQPRLSRRSWKVACNLWLGEWYLDLNEGTPYQTQVLGNTRKDP